MSGVTEFIQQLADVHKELVTNTLQFNLLKENTKEKLDDFKHLLERITDKLDTLEKDRVKSETELLSKINALEARLNALSEQALHSVMKEVAFDVIRDEYRKTFPNQQVEQKTEHMLPSPPSTNNGVPPENGGSN